MKTTKILNLILYTIAVLSAISILIWIAGGFEVAKIFHRSLTDWCFVWAPGFLDTIILIIVLILSIRKHRIVFPICLFYVLKNIVINIQVLFGNGFLMPDFLTLIGELIYFLFFPLALAGTVLWVIEFFKKSNG